MNTFEYDEDRAQEGRRPYQDECRRETLRKLNPNTPALLHIVTGGGKTFVADDFVAEWLSNHGGYALWVTKSWLLLGQATEDMAARHRLQGKLGRLGGGRNSGAIAGCRNSQPGTLASYTRHCIRSSGVSAACRGRLRL